MKIRAIIEATNPDIISPLSDSSQLASHVPESVRSKNSNCGHLLLITVVITYRKIQTQGRGKAMNIIPECIVNKFYEVMQFVFKYRTTEAI